MSGTITVGNSNVRHNQKEMKTKYPVTEGTTAGTTKQQGRILHLVAQESSKVAAKDKVGLR